MMNGINLENGGHNPWLNNHNGSGATKKSDNKLDENTLPAVDKKAEKAGQEGEVEQAHDSPATENSETQAEDSARQTLTLRKFFSPKEYITTFKDLKTVYQTGKVVLRLVWNDAKQHIKKSAAFTAFSSLMPTIQGGSFALGISAIETKNPFVGVLALGAIIGSGLIQNHISRQKTSVDTELQNGCRKAVERTLLNSTDLPGEVLDKKDTQDRLGSARDKGFLPIEYIQSAVQGAATSVALVASSVAVFSVSPAAGVVSLVAGLPLLLAAKERRKIWSDFYEKEKEVGRNFFSRRYNLVNTQLIQAAQMKGAQKRLADLALKELDKSNKNLASTVTESLGADKWPVIGQILATGGILGYCGYAAFQGSISLPEWSFVSGAVGGLSATISSFTGQLGSLFEVRQKLKPQLELYEQGKKQAEKEKLRTQPVDWSKPPKIEFKNVSLKYEGNEGYALRGVSFTIEPGESLLLVGENGAGKSSLMKLLSGVYSPTKGEILINGVNRQEISNDEWQEGFAILTQKDALTDSLTIGEDLSLGQAPSGRGKTPEEIFKKHGLHEVIKDENPLTTRIGDGYDRSFQPSGGQEKRFGIARTDARDAKVVVYDEPTEGLDREIKDDVMDRILKLDGHQTRILITHEYMLGLDCDKIIEMKKGGEIVALGKPKEFIKEKDTIFGKEAEKILALAARIEELQRRVTSGESK